MTEYCSDAKIWFVKLVILIFLMDLPSLEVTELLEGLVRDRTLSNDKIIRNQLWQKYGMMLWWSEVLPQEHQSTKIT